jgi:hypothetical protein
LTKTKAFILTILLTPIIAGLYGILHDQITYSISEEYYTKFKFIQFGFLKRDELITFPYPRLQVSAVGFMATWWTGLIIGINISLVSLMIKDPMTMYRALIKSIKLIFIITFSIGLLGLLVGVFLNEHNFYFPYELSDKKAFLMVGSMHTFSYIGGLIGLVTSLIYLFRLRRKSVA